MFSLAAASRRELADSAKALRNGAVMVFPTDTVYGIGTAAGCMEGRERIYAIKKRPASKALQILVNSIKSAKKLAEWNMTADVLSKIFWPGPLTMVMKPKSSALALACGFGGLGIRMPDNGYFADWAGKAGVPIAATSANISGHPACRREKDAAAIFDGKADYILLGGDLPGVESTVVDITALIPKILREGAVPARAVMEALR